MSNSALNVMFVPTRAIYTDAGTGALLSTAIYEPIFPEDTPGVKWCFFGHIAVSLPPGVHHLGDTYLDSIAPVGIVVQDDANLLEAASSDHLLYTDQGSGGKYDLALWSFKSAIFNGTGKPLGLFAYIPKNDDDYKTNPSTVKGINWSRLRTVKAGLLTSFSTVPVFDKIWDDHQSGADGGDSNPEWKDISFWKVRRLPTYFDPLTFVASKGYENSPSSITPACNAISLSNINIVSNSTCCWMSDNAAKIGKKPLQQICLPATHDSGTYKLTDNLVVDYDEDSELKGIGYTFLDKIEGAANSLRGVSGIGHLLAKPFEWAVSGTFEKIQWMSTAQYKSVLHQLADGIRALDIRVYHYENDFYAGHGLLGPNLELMLMDVKYFLEITHGEIVYITFGHWTRFHDFNSSEDDVKNRAIAEYNQFKTLVTNIFSNEYIITRPPSNNVTLPNNDPFSRTYDDLTTNGTRSKVILVWDMPQFPTGMEDDLRFWLRSFSPPSSGIGEGTNTSTINNNRPGIYGYYTNTEDKTSMITDQTAQMKYAAQNYYPFALYATLTPSPASTGLRVGFTLGNLISELAAPFLTAIPPIAIIAGGVETVAAGLKIGDGKFPWNTLEELYESQSLLSTGFDQLFTSSFNQTEGNMVSMIYTDFYHETSLVQQAIKMSTMPIQVVRLTYGSSFVYRGVTWESTGLGNVNYKFGPFNYDGKAGKFMLSSSHDGTGNLSSNGTLTITVTNPSVTEPKTFNAGSNLNQAGGIPPQDITSCFSQGDNWVEFSLQNSSDEMTMSSMYLVKLDS